jgi:hypothetical protein
MNYKEVDILYYDLGLNVLPVYFKTKHSLISWKEYQNKIIPKEVYEGWKKNEFVNNNCAIITGKIYRGPDEDKYLICIDIDNKLGIDEFLFHFTETKSLEELAKKTIVVQHEDAKDERSHIYFITEKPVSKKAGIKGFNKENNVPAIEVKSDSSTYVVCPPSVHQNGYPYQIIGTKQIQILDETESQNLQHALDKIHQKYCSSNNFNPSTGNFPNLTDELKNITKTLKIDSVSRKISIGNRNNTLLVVADSIISNHYGSKDIEVLEKFFFEVNQKLCEEPLDEKELDSIWIQATSFIEKSIKEKENFSNKNPKSKRTYNQSNSDLNNKKEKDIPDFLIYPFIKDVIKQRNQWIESSLTYQQWQSKVYEKYEKLREVIQKHYPEAWAFMEFCLAVKSILNIQDFTLPFMGVLIAAPSSMKTMIIQLFRKYPHTFYTDSFTPSSLISHISTKTEEQLQKVDMIPKMKDKVVLTPELAPIFTSKEDDLQKVMGITTRLLDGHGLENDSGSHGHRKYGNTMFVWLGATVEIPPRVWKILGSLGHKIYFLRPDIPKKTIGDLIKIAKSNNFTENNKEIEEDLLDYLKTFDACPEIDKKIRLDNQIVKVRWNEDVEDEQALSIEYIAQLANLLAHLRGTVYVSQTKAKNYKNQSENPQHQIEGQDYDTDFPIIEDPSRAVVLLRNLAIGHAMSQGRDYLNLIDIPIVIKVALSTAPVRRVRVLDLLLKSDNGEVTTSQIINRLSVSQPIASRTMRELAALGIAYISTVSTYENSELKIKLKPEFEWFKSQEFLKLKEEFVPSEDDEENTNNSLNELNENIVTDNDQLFDSSEPTNKDILSFIDNTQIQPCDK